MSASRLLALSLACACLCIPDSAAAESPWSIGLRGGISAAGGVPSNDSINMAFAMSYRLDGGGRVGVAVESMDFDFEMPHRIVGIRQDRALEPEDIDSAAGSTLVAVFYERQLGESGARWTPYWSVALGFASPDTPTVTGPVQGGGTFEVHTDAGTEYIPGARAGYRWNFAPSWSADFSLSVNHHLADWKVEDRQSGATDRVDDYTHYGAQLGVVYRFGAQ